MLYIGLRENILEFIQKAGVVEPEQVYRMFKKHGIGTVDHTTTATRTQTTAVTVTARKR